MKMIGCSSGCAWVVVDVDTFPEVVVVFDRRTLMEELQQRGDWRIWFSRKCAYNNCAYVQILIQKYSPDAIKSWIILIVVFVISNLTYKSRRPTISFECGIVEFQSHHLQLVESIFTVSIRTSPAYNQQFQIFLYNIRSSTFLYVKKNIRPFHDLTSSEDKQCLAPHCKSCWNYIVSTFLCMKHITKTYFILSKLTQNCF